MKKFIFTIISMVFSLVLVTPAFANEQDNQELEKLSQTGEVIYEDDEITVISFGNNPEISDAIFNHPNSVVNESGISSSDNIITPSSVTGPGGRASIVAGDSGRIVYWSVKPATAWPYQFSGFVKLRYYSGFKRDVAVSGFGALGSTVSGAVSMKKNNGGVAYLSGTAYALSGSLYRVLPGVSTTFRPN
ncbi:hypothetical protein [Neobacillus sp.]|uniref:hypothetical protein n=1 Tax=Neobacillus sp. TaxID=2675273 RepID=UPI0035B5245C